MQDYHCCYDQIESTIVTIIQTTSRLLSLFCAILLQDFSNAVSLFNQTKLQFRWPTLGHKIHDQ